MAAVSLWTPAGTVRWGVATAAALLYVLSIVSRRLHLDPAATRLLTAATVLTLARAAVVAVLAGFAAAPPLRGPAAWIPALLYTAAAVADVLDGRIARRREETTRFGAALDVETDALGVLVGSLLVVHRGTLPPVFVGVGLLYYVFRLFRAYVDRGGAAAGLPPSRFRRAAGAILVTSVCVAAYPVVLPPWSYLVGAVGAAFALVSFGRDAVTVARSRPPLPDRAPGPAE